MVETAKYRDRNNTASATPSVSNVVLFGGCSLISVTPELNKRLLPMLNLKAKTTNTHFLLFTSFPIGPVSSILRMKLMPELSKEVPRESLLKLVRVHSSKMNQIWKI
jgi:hypothetical protein